MSNYQENLEAQRIFKSCKICQGKGFIIDRRTLEKQKYTYTLHCTCDLGEQFKDRMFSFESKYTAKDIITRRLQQRKTPTTEETKNNIRKMLGVHNDK